MSRFKKQNQDQEKQSHYHECIAHKCPLPTYRQNSSGVRVSCLFHILSETELVRDEKTKRINENIGLIQHYIKWLRNKTIVELELEHMSGRQSPGIAQYPESSKWNRAEGETWQAYKQRFGQMLFKLINSGSISAGAKAA